MYIYIYIYMLCFMCCVLFAMGRGARSERFDIIAEGYVK